MLILSLDTTTRAGSAALVRDGRLVAVEAGDPSRTHGERLPGEIVALLERHAVRLADIDLFAVAAGPGSFTGLRVGIATLQGLALAHRRGLIGVSALDALAWSVRVGAEEACEIQTGEVAAWIDARRHEVFAALYAAADSSLLDGPLVGKPEEILTRWAPLVTQRSVRIVGDGAVAYQALCVARAWRLVEPTPLLAPAVARLAARMVSAGSAPGPGAIRPLYIRRPDAVLARDRVGVQGARQSNGATERSGATGPRATTELGRVQGSPPPKP